MTAGMTAKPAPGPRADARLPITATAMGRVFWAVASTTAFRMATSAGTAQEACACVSVGASQSCVHVRMRFVHRLLWKGTAGGMPGSRALRMQWPTRGGRRQCSGTPRNLPCAALPLNRSRRAASTLYSRRVRWSAAAAATAAAKAPGVSGSRALAALLTCIQGTRQRKRVERYDRRRRFRERQACTPAEEAGEQRAPRGSL